MYEITLGIIKPDAVNNHHVGEIINLIEKHSFDILELRKATISPEQARTFYAVHKDKPFFEELVAFITSGPVILMALGKENGIMEWRTLMGATDPAKAHHGTIRKLFGTSIGNNAVHGSDAPETAREELGIFFPNVIK